MVAERLGADADDVTYSRPRTAPQTPHAAPEIAMKFFNSSFMPSLQPASNDQAGGSGLGYQHRPDPANCGWYDSSFELRDGLEVIERHDDTLFQLWQLAAGMSVLR